MKIYTIPTGMIQANSYVLIDERTNDAVLIDCGAAEKQIFDALDSLRLHALLLTHGHWDHILGAFELKDRTEASVLIHVEDAPKMIEKALSGAAKYGMRQQALEPDVLVNDGDILNFGSITLRVLHTPGHTEGSVCYLHEPSRSLFTGDTLFKGTCGRTDLPGGEWVQMRESLARLRKLPGDYDVYPGHDEASTLESERANNRYMQEEL